jgi:DNA-binding transcriptional LysR family regulator
MSAKGRLPTCRESANSCRSVDHQKQLTAPRRATTTPQDLTGHNCINLRLPTYGGLYAWEFEKGGEELKLRVEGQLVLNDTGSMLNAALAGFGLAHVPEDAAQPHPSNPNPRSAFP